MEREVGWLMPVEDDWEMEPCLRKFECEPGRNGGEWRCGFCGVEMLMMRVLRPEPPPTAEQLAERQAQAERLVAMMTDPNPEPDLGPKGKLPGETDEQMISRVCKEVREGPEPRPNAGGPGCWRTPEPDEPVEVRMDVEGNIVSSSWVKMWVCRWLGNQVTHLVGWRNWNTIGRRTRTTLWE